MKTKAGREAWRQMHQLMFGDAGNFRFPMAAETAGVTPGQLKTLLHLNLDEGVSMRDLAEHWRCDPSYITGLADEMEAAGLASRQAHPTDRRIKMLVLTAEGEAAKTRALEILYEPPRGLEALTPAEQRLLRDLVRRMVEADPAAARGWDRGLADRGANRTARLAARAERLAAGAQRRVARVASPAAG